MDTMDTREIEFRGAVINLLKVCDALVEELQPVAAHSLLDAMEDVENALNRVYGGNVDDVNKREQK